MNHNYPHISDTKFPDLPTVDVYRYRNEYDYNKYADSVRIKMMNVSWCGDYDNVVYFEAKSERDAWFEEQTGLVKELPTMFRLYNDGTVKVDLPIDECMDYNYVMIDYGKLPSQEHKSDQSKMFYFINNVSQESPNATTLYLSVDYWTTFINDMDISYVNLARGHAPMAKVPTRKYLENPIDNSEYLLTNDVNYGEFQRISSNDNVVLNETVDDIYIGFMTNSNIDGNWEGKIPTQPYEPTQGYSAVDIFVIEAREWKTFREDVENTYPQFYATVKGMFLVPKKLVTTTLEFEFCGHWCSFIDSSSDKNIAKFDIDKKKFGYPDNIADIAKLYTFPYAAIEVNDFKGNTTIIKVEDTIGSLEMHTVFGYMYPFLNVESYMLGIGGDVKSTVKFRNSVNNTFHIGGRYYNFTNKWNIPVFAVQLSVENNWALNNKIGADAALANSNANAQAGRDQAALQVATNTANTGASNTKVISEAAAGVGKNSTDAQNSRTAMLGTVNNTIEARDRQASATNTANTAKAASGAVASVASGVISGAAAGGFAGAMAGLVSGGISAASSSFNAATDCGLVLNSTAIANDLSSDNADINANQIDNSASNANAYINDTAGYTTTLNNTLNANNNALTSGSANIAATTLEGNALRSYNALHDQTMLNNPPMYGNMTGTPDIISKPFGLSYNIVTQSKNAIRQAAEQFLRYGYMLNMEWNIDSFNKMPKFTYWECDKVYCNDNGVYEGAQDMIKSILNQGTTVWRKPEEIGLVSIYTNI